MRWLASDAHVFRGSEGSPFQNTRAALFYSYKLLKDSIFSRINVASYGWISLEGLTWEGKEGGCLNDTL